MKLNMSTLSLKREAAAKAEAEKETVVETVETTETTTTTEESE